MVNSSKGVRWKEPTVVIGVLALVIGLLAFGRDLFGFELFTETQPTAISPPGETDGLPITTSSSPTAATITTPSVMPATPPGSLLTDLEPKVGGGWIERRAGSEGSLVMPCATNTDGDKYRAVQYSIPRRHSAFQARVAPSGVVDDVRVDIRVDNVVRSRATLRPEQPDINMATAVAGGTTLELRLTCGKPGGEVVFSKAIMTN